jgi:hypothetical protein
LARRARRGAVAADTFEELIAPGDVTAAGRFVQQSMYYPVTDAAMDTSAYERFAEGYFLSATEMAWFWDAYWPDLERRSEP